MVCYYFHIIIPCQHTMCFVGGSTTTVCLGQFQGN
uniref:Uncharacterized protein n=1 Tax=Arundo donax TaxID=35708 RepID=A0A0A8Y141_ARUDO